MKKERKGKTYLAHLEAFLEDLEAFFEDHELVHDPKWLIQGFDYLNSLRAILMDHQIEALVGESSLESLARMIESILSKFDLKKMDMNMARELFIELKSYSYDWWTPRIIFDNWPKPSQKYYPRTDQNGFVHHLMEYLEQVMQQVKANSYNESIGPLKHYIFRIQRMLRFVSGCLVEVPEWRKELADMKILMEDFTNLAYDIEYAIDLFLVGEIPIWFSVFWLQDIEKDLKSKLKKLKAESEDVDAIIQKIRSPLELGLHTIALLSNITICNKLEDILKAVADNFEICTWGLASSYKENKKGVFLQLLRNASSHSVSLRAYLDKKVYKSDLSEYELEKLVQLLLKNINYFIILEDVDDIEDLEDITRVLPNWGRKFNRILLTTHSTELCAHCRRSSLITKISEDQTSSSTSQQHTKSTMEGDVVGFKTEIQRMFERLTGGSENLHIISIAGMAGLGKTTLAKKLYNDPSIISYFDTLAWCCVSQVYEKKKLLQELLGHDVQHSKSIGIRNDHELSEMLWKSLKGQRFLVVLDDIWSTGAWDDLKRCFPDNKNGSRIIFTTRLQELASKVQPGSVLQPLDQLSDDESWTLLQNKIFKKEKESCPPELLEVGMDIARYCKGLPLSVVLTAGLLKKMDKTQDVWKDIAESLSSRILGDADAEENGVIDLSYKHLPDFLKPCFLYFGAFLEDREVGVQKLIRLWIAEGFIKHSNSKSLEDVAEDYLLDLIKRSMVIVAQEKSNGGVKSCRVHDLLREFALTKATEENFFQQIQEYDEQLEDSYSKSQTSSTSGCLCIFSKSNRFNKLRPEAITYCQRRVCIYSKSNRFFNLRAEPLGPHVRSLLFFGASDMSPSYSYDISFIFRNFKLLKILNFEDINIGNSFKEIDVLLHLRYLAVQGTMVSIPSSIANLLNLETLYVKSLEDIVVEVPDSIWNITTLRHLHINGHPSFCTEPHRLENSSILDNLQTLSTPSLAYGDHMETILRKLRGSIRKLKCIFLDSRNDSTNWNQFPALDFLGKLESLKVYYNGVRRHACLFNFPSNLKKLTLTNFHMPWSAISQLVKLCNLEVLKLLENAFDGETWEMEDKVFQKLKLLKLESLNVVEWVAFDGNFPRLERLLLHKCEQLLEIPSSIGDVNTLLMIEVKWCSPSAAASALTIQEEQDEYGKELKINVHHKR